MTTTVPHKYLSYGEANSWSSSGNKCDFVSRNNNTINAEITSYLPGNLPGAAAPGRSSILGWQNARIGPEAQWMLIHKQANPRDS